ncbi:hypothetical protein R70006_06185 [Paraburkholderia domus]|uniref:hypothetical protein n=1 Tax=Paraburkholderia domus TaxID=2793075 RepID=UPI001911CFE6|nr:hypothetical protein [Paraburkholderia domus]MBK5052819.1 hypothetical protein [Burkholderia sp. R-70006]CAE6820748.1 hypothetical protein R70006_06185 [Paraburkholderia domus]
MDRGTKEVARLTALSVGGVLLVFALIASLPLTYKAVRAVGFATWFTGLSLAHPLWIGLILLGSGTLLFLLASRFAKQH